MYVTILGAPQEDILVKSLGSKTEVNRRKIKSITMLGSANAVDWKQEEDRLTISRPSEIPSEIAIVYKVTFRK